MLLICLCWLVCFICDCFIYVLCVFTVLFVLPSWRIKPDNDNKNDVNGLSTANDVVCCCFHYEHCACHPFISLSGCVSF